MKDTKPKCGCGKYCGYAADSGTYYGSADPEYPEPYDPTFFCKKCAKEEKKEMKKFCKEHGEGKINCVWWIKPDWYNQAIHESGFELHEDTHNYSLVKER